MFDNRIFSMNGCDEDMLLDTLRLVFKQEECRDCDGWSTTAEHGLVLLKYTTNAPGEQKFPVPLTADQVFPMVAQWLKSDGAKNVVRRDFDAPYDGDVANEPGWRVYCEDWGHVGDFTNALCAIKPVAVWLGK